MRGYRASCLARVGVLAAAAMLSGCAGGLWPGCASEGERQTAELVFGRVSSDAPGVSEAEFARFLDTEVSRRFPDGLTIVDAQDRWTPPAGSAIHGPSKMVMIVLRGRPDDRAQLEAVREAYRRRFHQPSVLLLTGRGCISL